MSDEMNPEQGREQEISESGLLRSVEPIHGGGGLSASPVDADSDGSDSGLVSADTDATDSDSDSSDTLGGGDADASDESDADSTDMGGDETESESGLGGENPLGINRTRATKNGDDKDTRDS
ncbi:MAG TPA: hypothetical protein VNA19_09090 [Pyrinomonadaceae bacterium]|jgi:hypothetical protein|nr:hypothetical protein [Pyrinomonadaceae bacterium]